MLSTLLANAPSSVLREYSDPAQLEPCPFRESAVLALLSWVPLGLGERLRRLFYRSLFAKADNSFRIFPGVELVGMGSISLGNQVVIRSQVSIEANSPRSQVRLGDRTVLDRGVDIRVVPGFPDCQVNIGADTYIGPYCCFAGPGNITIGQNCLIGSH
ncbi:MAG: hypothetical protein HC771_25675, partial [Synechococcales cyanobacterium CRU_2_2]|nr:hypothetical protein [Synechococcales cyanobacterium CRU_2_2]